MIKRSSQENLHQAESLLHSLEQAVEGIYLFGNLNETVHEF